MHYLHLVRVKASSPTAACKFVDNEISGFGNENNWYSICGCLSEDNVVYDKKEGRYSPEGFTIEKLNKTVREWLQPDEHLKSVYEKKEKNTIEWLQSQFYCEFMYHRSQLQNPDEFEVLNDVFYEYCYSNNGLTSFDSQADDDEKTYIVFVDMHS